MQLGWAIRVAAGMPPAASWAVGGAALLVARECFVEYRVLSAPLRRKVITLLGVDPADCAALTVFTGRLAGEARWALTGVSEPADLWRAEARWWTRVERDGHALLPHPGYGPDRVVGVVALLAVYARRRCARRWSWPREVAGRWRCLMPLSEAVQPVRMERVAVVAPADALRDALVRVADAGVVQLDLPGQLDEPGEAGRRLRRLGGGAGRVVSRSRAVRTRRSAGRHRGRGGAAAGTARRRPAHVAARRR